MFEAVDRESHTEITPLQRIAAMHLIMNTKEVLRDPNPTRGKNYAWLMNNPRPGTKYLMSVEHCCAVTGWDVEVYRERVHDAIENEVLARVMLSTLEYKAAYYDI